MKASRYCPVCGEFTLSFTAQASSNDQELIEVVAQCHHCKYVFLHHFDFEEMCSEEFGPVDNGYGEQPATALRLVDTANSGGRDTRR